MEHDVFATSVIAELAVFWDVTQFSPVKVYQRSKETCCLHQQHKVKKKILSSLIISVINIVVN
jgi:hypothetical protein